MSLSKMLLMVPASTLAASVMANLPDNRKRDPDITNEETKADNLMAFRLCHIMYDGLARAMDDKDGWNTPNFGLLAAVEDTLKGESALAKLILPALQAVLEGAGGPWAAIIGPIVELLRGGSKAPPEPQVLGPLPSPSDSLGE